jgi:hypothetical protein
MRPVDQSILHGDPSGARGDCLRACVASVLDLPLLEVPHFAEIASQMEAAGQVADQDKLQADWLAGRGLRLITISFSGGVEATDLYFGRGDEPYIAWGISPRWDPETERRFCHAVVVKPDGYGFKLVHDPHPSRAGVVDNVYRGFQLIVRMP